MKKILFLTFLALAMASFGSVFPAHAQTVTISAPASAPAATDATLQQQLELMKAKLQLLELQQMQDNQTPTAPVAMPATNNSAAATGATLQLQAAAAVPAQTAAGISPDDAAALNTALSALTATLQSLQTAIASNPQFLTENGPVVARSLSNIEGSLAAVLVSMQGGTTPAFEAYTQTLAARQAVPNAPAPKAVAVGHGAAASPAAADQGSLLPSVDSITQTANVPANSQNAAVAESALSGKNRLPAVIVGVILLAMIAILVWGRGTGELELETVKSAPAPKNPAPAKPAPVMPVIPESPSISFISNQPTAPNPMPNRPAPAPIPPAQNQSPLASAMGNQQRKTA